MRRLPELLVLLAVSTPAWALPADTSDPRVIMEAVEAQAEGDRMVARLSMTVTDAAGRERSRVVQSRAMRFEGGRKQLLIFESPADVRNAGLLSIDWDAGDKADDQWLYLPSLGRTTRISGADRSGSFMGTDLSFADLTKKDPAQYDYTLVQASAPVDGVDCWLVEARPKTEKEATETGYLKSQAWIDKQRLVVIQSKAWVTEGKKLKYLQFADYKQIGGLWIAHRIVVRTVRDKTVESTSTLVFDALALDDPSVTDADFTERRLEQGL